MSTITRSTPLLELGSLDDLWFQVAGTLCNLSCHHCFISCHPKNHSFGFLKLEEVRRRLEESKSHGVKEYYFTGGEPFLNTELVDMLTLTLDYGPATVLTNGTVLKPAWLQRLAATEAASRYSLEFRVSIDGFSPETNDPIRGKGTFDRAMQGIEMLVAHNFMPIITAARTWSDDEEPQVLEQFFAALRNVGYKRPRVKLLPLLQLGAETDRTRGYSEHDRVTHEMMHEFDESQLLCHHSRIVTDRGVHVCPILIEAPESRLGDSLQESRAPFELKHGACFTCYQYGAICSNPSSGQADPTR